MTLSGLEWDFQNTGLTGKAVARARSFNGTIDKFRRPGFWGDVRLPASKVLVRTESDGLNESVDGSVDSLTNNILHALSQGCPERDVYVLVRNEPNLGGREVNPDHGLQIGQAVKRTFPDVRLVTTTFSQNFGLPFAAIVKELDSPLFEFVGTHCYWETQGFGDDGWSGIWKQYDQQAQQRGKKFLVCEMNERSFNPGRAQRARIVMQEMAATGRCEAICIFVGEADPEFEIFKPTPGECEVLGFPLTFPVPVPTPDPVPEPGPEPGPVPVFDPNPFRLAVYTNPDGSDGRVMALARQSEAVILSAEIGWSPVPNMVYVETSKGRIYDHEITGAFFSAPFI